MKLRRTIKLIPGPRSFKVPRRSLRLPSPYPRLSILKTHRSPLLKLAWIFGFRL